MRNWIIRFLGGFTKQEMAFARNHWEQQFNQLKAEWEATVHMYNLQGAWERTKQERRVMH